MMYVLFFSFFLVFYQVKGISLFFLTEKQWFVSLALYKKQRLINPIMGLLLTKKLINKTSILPLLLKMKRWKRRKI